MIFNATARYTFLFTFCVYVRKYVVYLQLTTYTIIMYSLYTYIMHACMIIYNSAACMRILTGHVLECEARVRHHVNYRGREVVSTLRSDL